MAAASFLSTGPLATHADEVIAMATGRVLVLWATGETAFPPVVTAVDHIGEDSPRGPYDTIVSVGQLAAAEDLAALLSTLAGLLGDDGVLVFCEETVATGADGHRQPHDITAALWSGEWSVIECRRFRTGRGWGRREYCWGRARRTRYFGPRR